MKKYLFGLVALLSCITLFTIPERSEAQIVKPISIAAADDTLTNADTALVALTFDASFKSVEVWVKEVTGTTGGKVYFQAEYPHGGDYSDLDSLTLSDVATAQFALFTVPNPRLYKSFRLKYIKSGTGTAEIKGYYVRYTGGAILWAKPDVAMQFDPEKKSLAALNRQGYSDRWYDKYILTRQRSFKQKVST